MSLRLLTKTLGIQVDWNGATQMVAILGNQIFSLTTGQPLSNNIGTAVLHDGRTFVPLRYVANMLEADMAWNGDTQTIAIISGGNAASGDFVAKYVKCHYSNLRSQAPYNSFGISRIDC
ncbi:MAG: copper amine oxidase N-terminal domain-containing protein [Firmicutes bacterium]|nr:copper amine oxidase N-terminal domain-containing protein [Bacillota bacterium]